MKQLGIFLSVFLATQACKKSIAEYMQGSDEDYRFILEKTPCYGGCLSYRLTANGDGHAQISYRDAQGRLREEDTVLQQSEVTQLKNHLLEAPFWELDSVYNYQPVPDLPARWLMLEVPGLGYTKVVKTRFDQPEKVAILIRYMDSLRVRYFPALTAASPVPR